MPHQEEALAWLCCVRRGILANAMGKPPTSSKDIVPKHLFPGNEPAEEGRALRRFDSHSLFVAPHNLHRHPHIRRTPAEASVPRPHATKRLVLQGRGSAACIPKPSADGKTDGITPIAAIAMTLPPHGARGNSRPVTAGSGHRDRPLPAAARGRGDDSPADRRCGRPLR